jgi:hypothetical protein
MYTVITEKQKGYANRRAKYRVAISTVKEACALDGRSAEARRLSTEGILTILYVRGREEASRIARGEVCWQ